MPAIRIYESIVDGVTVATGTYPSRGQLLALAGLGEANVDPQGRPEIGLSEKSGGCCGGSTSCC